MKVGFRALLDPSVHLAALVALGALALAALGGASRASARPDNHPAHCHACSVLPPGAAEKTDAALVRLGCVEGAPGEE